MAGGEQPNQMMIVIASKEVVLSQPLSLLVVVLVHENEMQTEQHNDERADGPVHEDQLVVFIGYLL